MGGRNATTWTPGTKTNCHSPEANKKRADTIAVKKLIKGEVNEYIRKTLLSPVGKNENPFYRELLDRVTKEGLKDPNSPIGMYLFKEIMREGVLDMLDAETEKFMSKDVDFYQYRLQKRLFKEQKDVFNDFLSKKIAVMCSRRAGKTEDNSDIIVRTASIPNSPILYINLTFENAIRQMFDRVIAEAERVELTITKSSKSAGFIYFANGSSVLFKGNKDRSEADKMQGDKYRLVIIDEAQSQVNMNYLVDTIIRPMLADYTDSQLILTGTPPRRKGTYFEAVFNNPEWTTYSWDMFKNPYIADPQLMIQDICNEKGLTIDSPLIQREFFGKIAYDTEAQVFKGYKVYSGVVVSNFVPTHIYEGVDFGYADYNGIVTMAANVENRQAYIIYERKFNKATVSDIINAVREGFENGKRFLLERNPNTDLNNCQIFTDTNEKSITYELSQTYGLPAYCAYKYDKALAIEQLAEECRTGRVMNIEGGEIVNEFEQTLYKRDDLDNITSELDDGYHPDITMALLYASRQYFYDCGLEAGGESKNKQTGEF